METCPVVQFLTDVEGVSDRLMRVCHALSVVISQRTADTAMISLDSFFPIHSDCMKDFNVPLFIPADLLFNAYKWVFFFLNRV